MGLLMFFAALVVSAVGLTGYFVPSVRNAEDLLPDHDQLEKAEEDDPDQNEVESDTTETDDG
jgi:hypothetical protein